MPALFSKYEFHLIDVNPDFVRGWACLGGTEEYTVAETLHGEFHCTCPDWKYRGHKRRPMSCCHIEALLETLAPALPSLSTQATSEVS